MELGPNQRTFHAFSTTFELSQIHLLLLIKKEFSRYELLTLSWFLGVKRSEEEEF
jgi:hypothetical protein